jgi:hypothetical protein
MNCEMRLRKIADGCKARDEGRSQVYDAEERNAADAAIFRKPFGNGRFGRMALSPGLPREWPLAAPRFVPCIPKRLVRTHISLC